MATDLLGPWGESLAAEYLRKKHYELVGVNYRCRFGEIDIIAENKKYLVFVEVKLRKSAKYAEAMEFVDRRKQERLRQTAAMYLAQHETEKQPRFDVIEVYAPEGLATKKPELRQWEDAFESDSFL